MGHTSWDALKHKFVIIAQYFFFVAMSIVSLFPIYFAIVSSFKTTTEIMASKFTFPTSFSLENYFRAWEIGNMGRYFFNSMFLTIVSMVVLTIIGSLASYVLGRFKFRFQGLIYTFFIAGLMIPTQSVIIPLAFDLGALQIRDSYTALVLLFVAFQIPMTIFILSGFMKAIPTELEEAAIIDGCNTLNVFVSVILPMSIPAIVTASIFNFINIWNNLLFPLIFITSKEKQMISFGLLSFFSQWQADYSGVMAAITLAIIPPFIIYAFLQDKVEQGFTAGAVKG